MQWGIVRMLGTFFTQARHRRTRKIFFAQRGALRQHYREGMKDQLGALSLALNTVALFNNLYIDAPVKRWPPTAFLPPTSCSPG